MKGHISSIELEFIRGLSNPCEDSRSPVKLKPSKINVIIGSNGSGKSSVLDAIHALADDVKLCSLQTENTPGNAVSKCVLTRDSRVIHVLFAQDGKDFFNRQLAGIAVDQVCQLDWVSIPKKWQQDANLDKVRGKLLPYGKDILHIGKTCLPANTKIFVEELNKLGPLLTGLASELGIDSTNDPFDQEKIRKPVHHIDGEKFGVYLRSDLHQPSHVFLEQMPSGWVRYGSIISILASAPKNSVCLLDEPEANLHPKLQHKLIQRICEITSAQDHQVFIATHSNVFINTRRWSGTDIKLFWSRGRQVSEIDTCNDVLEKLGFKASDLLQTDGIIWVEGPSDRIYIKHWLELWCKKNGKAQPLENVDYSFAFYGGAILSHFQAGEEADLIDLLKINANAYVVMDNDNDFSTDASGKLIPRTPGLSKQRIVESVTRRGGHVWVTKGYTMESYLPTSFRDKYFVVKGTRLSLKEGFRKTDIAESFVWHFTDVDQCLQIDDLQERIEEVHGSILKWMS